MEEFKQDKRSVRTRKAIKIALLRLVRNKEIEAISITELTTLAGINRNSFYTHYENIYNIFDDINEDIIKLTDRIIRKYTYLEFRDDPYPTINEFSSAILANAYFSEYLLFSHSSAELVRKLKDTLCEKCYAVYASERGDKNPYIRYMTSFLVGGVFEIYYLWFKSDKQPSMENITRKISDFIKKGIVVIREIKTN